MTDDTKLEGVSNMFKGGRLSSTDVARLRIITYGDLKFLVLLCIRGSLITVDRGAELLGIDYDEMYQMVAKKKDASDA